MMLSPIGPRSLAGSPSCPLTYPSDLVTTRFLEQETDKADKKPFANRGYSSLYTVGFNMCSCANTPDRSEVRG